MTDDAILFMQEEFVSYVTSDSFTREDLAEVRVKLQDSGVNKTVCRAVVPLIRIVRSEFVDATAKAKEEGFKDGMAKAIELVNAARQGGANIAVQANSESSSVAASWSHAYGEKIVGDKIDIRGDVTNAAVGSGARFKARDVTAFKQVVETASLDGDVKAALVKAREALDAAGLSLGDAEDASDDLGKFAAELEKPDKDPGRIQKIWARIQEVAPTVATVLASATSIAKLLGV